MTDDLRVGVYVCHCGGNISDVVDVERVVAEIAKHPHVKVARNSMFMCSDPGQQQIIDDIQKNGINRVVVSACAPALHETTFRTALQRAGLNPYLYENVNIREQVSWVHKGDHEAATAKAIRLVRAGVEKVLRQDPLEAIRVHAVPHVLVIGAGVAGMRAAVAAARRGLRVTLVEKADRMGGRLHELDTVYPTGEQAAALVAEMEEAVRAEDAIDVILSAEVQSVDGYVGNFVVRVAQKTPLGPETREVKAGVIVMATGFEPYRPRVGELGFGSPAVVTLLELPALVAASGKELMVAGRAVRNVAFIHCVGSRQAPGVHGPQSDGKVNDYCSRVCCTAALHAVNGLLDRFPGLQVYELYKDIRTYGRGHEALYEAAAKKGALFFRYTDDGLPEVSEGLVKVRDWLTWGEEVQIPVDLVVLVTGMMPSDISDLTSMLKLPVGADRFLQEVHPKLRPVEVANSGILLAGTAQGPMDIAESCAAAGAAIAKAAILLSKGSIELDPYVARVDAARCDGCARCLPECGYKDALTMQAGLAVVNPALCVGCGACVAVCPPRALSVAGWSLDQFDAMVDALVAEAV